MFIDFQNSLRTNISLHLQHTRENSSHFVLKPTYFQERSTQSFKTQVFVIIGYWTSSLCFCVKRAKVIPHNRIGESSENKKQTRG